MIDNEHAAIAAAKVQRDKLCEECFQLLHQVSRKPSCLKLLQLAKNHLGILAAYKSNRGHYFQLVNLQIILKTNDSYPNFSAVGSSRDDARFCH